MWEKAGTKRLHRTQCASRRVSCRLNECTTVPQINTMSSAQRGRGQSPSTARARTAGAAVFAERPAAPAGEQRQANEDAQTGLVVYAVIGTLKLVPESFI